MKITFLGTGTSTGVPTLGCTCSVCRSKDPHDKRLRCSSLLEVDGKKILIDCGPDFRQQALAANLTWADAILITHGHSDHVAGIDDLRTLPYARYAWNLPPEMASGDVMLPRLKMFCSTTTAESLRKLFYYCFPKDESSKPHYKGMLPLLQLQEIKEPLQDFEVDGIVITPIKAMHSYLPVLGFRIKNFAYLTDVKTIEETELEKLKGLDVLVLGMLRNVKPHISHLSLDEAMEIVETVKPKQVYFVHMSHDIGFHANFHQLTYAGKKPIPENCNLAYDGLQIEIDD